MRGYHGSPWRLCGFNNFSRADAGRADSKFLVTPVYYRADAAQVGIPATPGEIVSMAHPIPVMWTFTAEFTHQCHSIPLQC